jgi:hypothetical protein
MNMGPIENIRYRVEKKENSMKLQQNFAAVAALSGAVFIGLAGISNTALGASTTGSASAVIVSPISVTAGATLNFGTIDPGTAGGTVVVDTTGTATYSGVTNVPSGAATPAAGTFTIGGDSTLSYNVSFTAGSVTSGANSMTVDTFTSSSTNSGSTMPYALTGGSDTLTVGGKLTVGASQAAGTYTGTYTVTVVYN